MVKNRESASNSRPATCTIKDRPGSPIVDILRLDVELPLPVLGRGYILRLNVAARKAVAEFALWCNGVLLSVSVSLYKNVLAGNNRDAIPHIWPVGHVRP